jgi:hypothetical protein
MSQGQIVLLDGGRDEDATLMTVREALAAVRPAGAPACVSSRLEYQLTTFYNSCTVQLL